MSVLTDAAAFMSEAEDHLIAIGAAVYAGGFYGDTYATRSHVQARLPGNAGSIIVQRDGKRLTVQMTAYSGGKFGPEIEVSSLDEAMELATAKGASRCEDVASNCTLSAAAPEVQP